MKIKFITLSIIVLFTSFGIWRSKDILLGSPIQFELKDKSGAIMAIEGKAKHSKELTVNGNPQTMNQKGDFSYSFSPLPGMNVVTINSKDIFGNSKEKVYSFVYNNEQGNKTAQR